MAGADTSGFQVERIDLAGDRSALRFVGELRFRDCYGAWDRVRELLAPMPPHFELDVSGLDGMDGGATALLLELRSEAAAAGSDAAIVGATGRVQSMLELYGGHPRRPSLLAPPATIGILEQIGRETRSLLNESNALDFVGDTLLAGAQAARSPGRVNWRDVPRLMERAGADGIPIVLMINFLVGLVTGFQAALQLKQFGANIFVADLVGLSVTRELAPLMTAIIIAGRSGAAFSAELGTMRVSEEIDALRTLGLDPFHFLVFPRVLALTLVAPLLTILADVIGIAGGLLVAMFSLDLTFHAYLAETEKALDLFDVSSGILKSAVFGLNVALIACQRGLATRGGAEGVGRSTTSAVVTSLFAIVVVDAIFTVIFHAFGR
ncbi:MAG: MlaE family lipid ABC transporter permease subunit [Deltaproteobacteria bacterium]|nr:MlaE family lipid ABC transporter permease subunit [Deltaproteobacteria bacterium]